MAGAGGARAITGDFDNQGLFRVTDVDLTLSNNVFTNSGATEVSNADFAVSGAGALFDQLGTIATANGGEIIVSNAASLDGDLVAGEQITLVSGNVIGDFDNAGTLLAVGTVGITGTLSNLGTGVFRTLGGSGNTAVTVDDINNQGTFELTSTGFGISTLTVNNGPLVNTGTFDVLAGGGGSRAIGGDFDNQGLFRVTDVDLTLSNNVFTNSGATEVSNADFALSGAGALFDQLGTIATANGGEIIVSNAASLEVTWSRENRSRSLVAM